MAASNSRGESDMPQPCLASLRHRVQDSFLREAPMPLTTAACREGDESRVAEQDEHPLIAPALLEFCLAGADRARFVLCPMYRTLQSPTPTRSGGGPHKFAH